MVGKDPSCFLSLTGADGARLRLLWALDNPNKASGLVGATKGARTSSASAHRAGRASELLSYVLAHIMVGSTPACFCFSLSNGVQ